MKRRRLPSGDPKLGVGYIRASKDEQKITPGVQREAIGAYAKAQGITILAWFEDLDVESTTGLEKREGLTAAVQELRSRKCGALIVLRRDRLARDVILAATIERVVEHAGGRVVSSSGEGNGDAPHDRLTRTIVDGVAAWEKEMIGLRTKAAIEQLRKEGRRFSREPPYGLKLAGPDQKQLVPDEHEQAAIRYLKSQRKKGITYARLAELAAARGFTQRNGKKYTIDFLSKLLRKHDLGGTSTRRLWKVRNVA